MDSIRHIKTRAMLGAAISLFAASTVQAQARLVLPSGSVIIVRTQTPLESTTARVGQTFDTIVEDTVGIDNYTVIPEGSHIRGVISFVQPANRQQSGVIEVDFDRLTLSDGTSFPIQGRLTSTDPTERRQIDSNANQRVVLVGGRGGIGAAIAGAGSQNSSTSSLLGALGSLLSEGRNVAVPAGTPLAVQLEQAVTLRGRGSRLSNGSGSSIYTDATTIRAAQRALAAKNYYRGTADGTLNYSTQRAIAQFQSDQNMTPTGNLDWRTAQALGLTVGGGGTGIGGAVLSSAEASSLRRNAQALVGRERQDLSISTIGRLNVNRAYAEGDISLWFALSAFADNAELYEQIIQGGGSSDAAVIAGRSLIDAARRVDTAFQAARPSGIVRNGWLSIRSQLATIDGTYSQ
jgi:peptidoglycan hydrolase-like protein with peptidoglycan-binding domain